MLRWISGLGLNASPAEFESSYGLDESVERLRAATKRSVFSAMAQQEAVGTVKPSRVSLQRVIPMFGNSFKPFYRGRFIERDGKVILTGCFTIHWLAKIFMAAWFGGLVSFILIGMVANKQAPGATLFPLFGLGMIAVGVAMVRLGKWFGRNDAAWLSGVIENALNARKIISPDGGTNSNSPVVHSEQTPTVILATTAVLVLLGAMGLVSATVGVQSFHADPRSVTITHYSNSFSRFFSAGYGLITLVLAWGVYHRRMIAWRAGIVFLVAGWIGTVVAVIAIEGLRIDGIVFSVLGLLVAAFWIRWWHAQRIYFRE